MSEIIRNQVRQIEVGEKVKGPWQEAWTSFKKVNQP